MNRSFWRRYLLSLLLFVVSAASLGVYYGYAADERLPAFRLETVQGDPAWGEPIALSGNYGGRMRSKPLEVGAGGSRYLSDTVWSNMFDRHRWPDDDPALRRLMKQYPGFMRGKSQSLSMGRYDVNGDWLVIADFVVGDPTIRLSALDRRTGRAYQHTVLLEKDKGSSITLQEIRLTGDRLHLFAVADVPGSAVKKTFIDYVTDPRTGEMTEAKPLALDLPSRTGAYQVSYGINGSTGSSYAIIDVGISTPTEHPTAAAEETSRASVQENPPPANVEKALYAYRYTDGKLTSLSDVLKTFGNPNALRVQLDGDVLLIIEGFGKSEKYGLPSSYRINRLDLASGSALPGYSISARHLGVDWLGYLVYGDGAFRFAMQKGNRPMAAVLDASTGKLLYEGRVVYEGDADDEPEILKDLQLPNLGIHYRE